MTLGSERERCLRCAGPQSHHTGMRGFKVLLGLGIALWTFDAPAHIELDEPTVRDAEMKDSPCGGASERTTDPSKITSFAPGEVVTVRWHETVPHPGYFRIAFSMDGVTFPEDPPMSPRPTVAFPVLAVIEKDLAETEYEAQVTMPDVECDTCTIQLIQYMEQHTPPPWYYQCADIVLTDDGGGAGTGGGSGSGGTGSGTSGTSGAGTSGTSGGGANPGVGGGLPSGGGSPPASGGGTQQDAGVSGSAGSSGVNDGPEGLGCALALRGAGGSAPALLALLGLGLLARARRRG